MSGKGFRVLIAVGAMIFALLGAGCSTQAKRVDCDGTLKPINKPAAGASSKTPVSHEGTATDEK
jgi:hypothetical protein